MNFYSKNKFLELSLERKVRVTLDLIQKIEDQWLNETERKTLLSQFKDYFLWTEFHDCKEPVLQKLGNLQFSIDGDISLRRLLDFTVPMERFLNLSVKDEHILRVKEGDRSGGRRTQLPLFFILDHLRSAFNVGSLFRTAECLGVEHVYLVGYTPTPEDLRVQKTAMGTEKDVSWSTHHHLSEVLEKLKDQKVSVVALETVEGSQSLSRFKAKAPLAFLVGNERFGLSQQALASVDGFVEIPMMGNKNSLNVANSLSIATFEVVRQWS